MRTNSDKIGGKIQGDFAARDYRLYLKYDISITLALILDASVVKFDPFDVQQYHEMVFIFSDNFGLYRDKIAGRASYSVIIRQI